MPRAHRVAVIRDGLPDSRRVDPNSGQLDLPVCDDSEPMARSSSSRHRRRVIGSTATAMGVALAAWVCPAPAAAGADDQAIPGCGHLCELGGTITFTHPSWGPSELMIGVNHGTESCYYAAFDQQDVQRWLHHEPGCLGGARPLVPMPDIAGNMFVFDLSGHAGAVTVLRATEHGMADLGSLTQSDGSLRFYDSQIFDVDDDGDFEIIQVERACVPDCATGDVYFRTFTWNGDDFFTELCTKAQRPPVPIQATPGGGGTIVAQIPAGTCGVAANVIEFVNESVWAAVWYEDQAGWAPVDGFELPPTEPPWPPGEGPFDEPPPAASTVPPAPPPTSPPACGSYRFNDQYPIRRCDEGYAVLMIQFALVEYGFVLDADGYFGPGTEQAVRDFQLMYGLEVDGLVGPNTWVALVGPQPGWDLDGNGIIDPDEVIWD